MSLHRRSVLGGAALAALATSARAQTPPAAPSLVQPSLEDRYAQAARANRMRLAWDGRRFSGPGWDFLAREASAAQFLLLGEDHFIAEIPRLAGQLYRDGGYQRASIEISPPSAGMIDAALRDGGLEGLTRWQREHPTGVAFYNLRTEAEFLADVRAATPGRGPVIWGTDYEMGADRALISRLKQVAPAPARAAVQAMQDASLASWRHYGATGDFLSIFPFGGDPQLVRAVRATWPAPDEEARLILDTLETTLVVNGHYRAERYYLSNQTRADFQRASFLRHWRRERTAGARPKVLLKYGWNHVVRGLSYTYNFDLGSLVSELAEIEGGRAFRVLAIGGPGARQGVFNPAEWKAVPTAVESFDKHAMTPVAGQHFETGFTVIDLRPLRLLPASKADPRMIRIVHGFDALVVLPGATANDFLLPPPALAEIGASER